MSTPNYVPGQGYSHGYEARMEGKEMPESSLTGLYWDEYRAGWFDAHKIIIENAKNDYKEFKKKLHENSERRQFLQD